MSLWCGVATLVMLHGTILYHCSHIVTLRHSPLPPRKLPCRNNAVITDFRARENNGRYVIGYLGSNQTYLDANPLRSYQVGEDFGGYWCAFEYYAARRRYRDNVQR